MTRQIAALLCIIILCAVFAAFFMRPTGQPGPGLRPQDFAIEGWGAGVTLDQIRAKLGPPFQEQKRGRGMVFGWAPHLVVLSDATATRVECLVGWELQFRGHNLAQAPILEETFLLTWKKNTGLAPQQIPRPAAGETVFWQQDGYELGYHSEKDVIKGFSLKLAQP